MWFTFVVMTRQLVSKVTGPLARTSALDSQAVYDFWDAFDNLWAFTSYARGPLKNNIHLGQPIGVASVSFSFTQ